MLIATKALALKARTVWTDPEDGRQYYFTQMGKPMEGSTSTGFFPLNRGGFLLPAAISPGVATPYTLELRVFSED